MTGSEVKKGNREKLVSRLKDKYPELDFDDDDVLYDQANADYDAYESRLKDYESQEKSLSDLFASDPRGAAFLSSWANGGDPFVEFARLFGDDFMDSMEDPEKMEAFAAASKEFSERVAKEKEFEEVYNSNISETFTMLQRVQEARGWSDEEIDAVMELLVSISKDAILGKFSEESVDMAYKALHHDMAVEEAASDGELRGRNAKIEETLRKSARNGDGTAMLSGKNAGSSNVPRPEFGAIDNYANTQSIWERGGEKRKRY